MGLSQALSAAAAGLRVTQAGLSLVAANVANAETPGYVRKTLAQQTTFSGDAGFSVRPAGIDRMLNQYLQRQLRTEGSGAAYADLRAQFYQRLQQIYGDPGSATSLETLYNEFVSAVQGLTASPADFSARAGVLSAAQVLAQQLNRLTDAIQGLRSDAEQALADAARSANEATQRIAQINEQLGALSANDAATAALLDQRDQYVDALAQLMDIRVSEGVAHRIEVFTSSGLALVGAKGSVLSFDAQGTMTPTAQWSADPDTRGVGTLLLVAPTGGSLDLLADNAIHSGQISAYVEMRDQALAQAQTQIDEFAAALARALSERRLAGTAVAAGAQAGYDIDVGGLLAGNSVSITYTDAISTQRTVTIMRVDDPAALPLSDAVTLDPNDRVIGIDWSGGLAAAIGQLNATFNGLLQFSNPSGSTLRVLNDGAGMCEVDAVSATTTASALSGGSLELPFFLDGGFPFSGAITSIGSQTVGLAGRIAVNGALIADPSKLVAYQSSTPSGDPARPTFIYEQLTSAALTFSPQTGIGASSAPFVGPLSAYLRQVLSQQGDAAVAAKNLSDGQGMVVDALRQRFADESGVNIDQEMTNLLLLQSAYAANARVLATVREVMELLLGI